MAVLLALLLIPLAGQAATAEPPPVSLQLEVRLNGYPANVIAAFALLPDGQLASARSELTDIGILVPGDGPPDELIRLNSIAGVTYVYDEAAQSIAIELPDGSRAAKTIDGAGKGDLLMPASSTGAVVNYTAHGSANYNIPNSTTAVDGANLSLDARAFSRFGALRQTGIVGTTTFSDFTALRLDTNWTWSDPGSLRTYQLGDIISGGLAWTRPIRMGGIQVRRNFGLRPDLITMPLPQIDGSAEVPSTVKVFVGGIETYSSDVSPGPFRIENLPVYTSSGTARVVLTDATGREIDSEQEFFTSPDLLKKDLYDFSLEAGVARTGFGSESFGYDNAAAAASLRYGLADMMTAEFHAEAQRDLIDVGVGSLVSAGRFGLFNAAIAASDYKGDTGLFVHAGWEARFGRLGLNLSTSRAFGDFNDLAAVTARPTSNDSLWSGVPRALDQIGVNYGFPELKAGIGVNFVHQLAADGKRSLIVSGSYTQSFGHNLTAYVSGFSDFGRARDYGAFAGFSMPLGDVSISAGIATAGKSWTAVAEATKTSDGTPGSYGWTVADGEGNTSYSAAGASYQTSNARLEGRIIERGGAVNANVAIDGAVVAANGGLLLGNHIADSFAVIDAGAPGVKVEYENRYAGTTGGDGKLLLPQLRSFERNKIAINVNDLPLAAVAPQAEVEIVPRELSGVVVDFGVKTDQTAALLTLKDGDGKDLTPGATVSLAGSPETFTMGYDGQVYLTGVGPQNDVTVTDGPRTCQVHFAFKPEASGQASIGPLPCG
ncbi:MAG: fimbrial biogenesis outer membrane usher protein [Rhizobiales bacterium]|nr:fimbrial biogenesis outer membrane usher protein [Hyphomicrobiales bacterium]MBI3672007.1 fimbrial biogenesis outer membrane usher protein [Hyphomicrobiales bacterium]